MIIAFGRYGQTLQQMKRDVRVILNSLETVVNNPAERYILLGDIGSEVIHDFLSWNPFILERCDLFYCITPHSFEGRKKAENARKFIELLKELHVKYVICDVEQKLKTISKHAGFKEFEKEIIKDFLKYIEEL